MKYIHPSLKLLKSSYNTQSINVEEIFLCSIKLAFYTIQLTEQRSDYERSYKFKRANAYNILYITK